MPRSFSSWQGYPRFGTSPPRTKRTPSSPESLGIALLGRSRRHPRYWWPWSSPSCDISQRGIVRTPPAPSCVDIPPARTTRSCSRPSSPAICRQRIGCTNLPRSRSRICQPGISCMLRGRFATRIGRWHNFCRSDHPLRSDSDRRGTTQRTIQRCPPCSLPERRGPGSDRRGSAYRRTPCTLSGQSPPYTCPPHRPRMSTLTFAQFWR
jgi:hypothetical protein